MAFIRYEPVWQGKRSDVVSRGRALAIQKLLRNPSQASKKDQAYIKHIKAIYLGGQSKPQPEQQLDWWQK